MKHVAIATRSYRTDYKFIASGAHRSPSYPIQMPAVTWHLGFWQPPLKDLPEEDWIKSIELDLILGLYDSLCDIARDEGWPLPVISNLQEAPSTTENGPHHLLQNSWELVGEKWTIRDGFKLGFSRYESVRITGLWQSMPVSLQVEVFEEYFTLTITISLWDLPASKSKKREKFFNTAYDEFSELSRAIDEIWLFIINRYNSESETTRTNGARLPSRNSVESLHNKDEGPVARAYQIVWANFAAKGQPLNNILSDDTKINTLGKVFCDIRGLVLRKRPDGTPDANGITKYLDQRSSTFQSQTLCSVSDPLAANDNSIDSQRELNFWVQGLLHVLKANEDPEVLNKIPGDAIEYTFSTAYDRRCIYGTGFGHQEPTSPNDRFRRPITYITLVSHDDHRRIGRFVNRLHTLGTSRLAAAVGLHEIMNSDLDLFKIRSTLSDVSSALSEHFYRVRHHASLRDKIKEALLFPYVWAIYSKDIPGRLQQWIFDVYAFPSAWGWFTLPQKGLRFSDIDKVLFGVRKEFAHIDKKIDCDGISYRIMRSKYYRERIQVLIESSQFVHIPGYQTYPRFVLHRMDRVFSRIAGFGERYGELVRLEEDLRQQFLSQRSEGHQREIRKLQVAGEFFLIAFLVPYYVCNLINEHTHLPELFEHHLHMVFTFIDQRIGGGYAYLTKTIGRVNGDGRLSGSGIVTSIYIWLCFFVYAIYRIRRVVWRLLLSIASISIFPFKLMRKMIFFGKHK